MFCPKCGASEQSVNTYCKRCGGWLEESGFNSFLKLGGASLEQSIVIMTLMSFFGTLFLLFAAVTLYVGHSGRADAHWTVNVSATLCFTVAIWLFSSFIIGLKLRAKLKRNRAGERETGASHAEARSIADAPESAGAAHPASAANIKESTTKLLEPLPQRRTEQKHR